MVSIHFGSGYNRWKHLEHEQKVSTGDARLDSLLGGGLVKELVHLFYGDSRILQEILTATMVRFQKFYRPVQKTVFVDSNNRFNPYAISKLAVRHRLNPSKVLTNILISRAFTWEQMVELLANRLESLDNIGLVIIQGITKFFAHKKKSYEDLWSAIGGIKKLAETKNPILILTAPRNPYSEFKPLGGHALYHTGNVLVYLKKEERKVKYHLVQHPFLPEKKEYRYFPLEDKRKLKQAVYKNYSLDKWI